MSQIDGFALWQEHRPQSAEDWIAVARRCNAANADRSVMARDFYLLCVHVAEVDALARRIARTTSGGAA